jgi:hypothetical protein
MIVYNTTFKLEKSAHAEWLHWMKTVHIPDILECQQVLDYRIFRLLLTDDEGDTYAVQLYFPDMAAFEDYYRSDGILHQRILVDRYKDRYVSFSTLMLEV